MGCKEGIFFHNEHRRPWGRALITREKVEDHGLLPVSAGGTSTVLLQTHA